ncbi:forkhead box protein P1 isoform 2-T2 [Pholidichthys leucotaenia]
MEDIREKQLRPSVLCQLFPTASGHAEHSKCTEAVSICKEEDDADHLPQSSSSHLGSSLRANQQLLPLRKDSPKQTLITAGVVDTGALFVSGLCRWPGCDAVSQDFSSFLKHLHSEHRYGDRSIAQWRVQQDIVQCMENQLILEKQKLFAMHLHLSDHKSSDLKTASQWHYSLPLLLHQPLGSDGEQQWSTTHLEELMQPGYRTTASAHLLPDLPPSMDCYKYTNIRPPYTYAYLIRWSILESPDKQRTLNEIYNWFTTMFFYFRHNTATWKNAVRHNLSLHKCFVRVEGGKGAVWTVDEDEYQRRKGQKYQRDCPVKWLTQYSHYYSGKP